MGKDHSHGPRLGDLVKVALQMDLRELWERESHKRREVAMGKSHTSKGLCTLLDEREKCNSTYNS